MPGRALILAAVAVIAAGFVTVVLLNDGDSAAPPRANGADAGRPRVHVISPRNGARQASHAVVVKVSIGNFTLAPAHFGEEPQIGEGHIRFSLNRVPNCVDPVKLQRALNSPIGHGRLVGNSFDFAAYSGPNGALAEQIGSAGSYSPGTRPEIFYRDLPPGFYRLVVTLAQNDGSTTPFHAVTNFQILSRPGHGPKACSGGKVSSAKAAAFN
jgi:hypothetical protein